MLRRLWVQKSSMDGERGRRDLEPEWGSSSCCLFFHFSWILKFLSSSSIVRDLSKGGKTEYTSQKHTMDLNQKSLVRQNLAAMLQGSHHAPV